MVDNKSEERTLDKNTVGDDAQNNHQLEDKTNEMDNNHTHTDQVDNQDQEKVDEEEGRREVAEAQQ